MIRLIKCITLSLWLLSDLPEVSALNMPTKVDEWITQRTNSLTVYYLYKLVPR